MIFQPKWKYVVISSPLCCFKPIYFVENKTKQKKMLGRMLATDSLSHHSLTLHLFPYNASEWWLTLSVCLTVYGNGIMLNKWQKSELSLSGTNILPDGEPVESVTWDYSGHILRDKHRGYQGCAELNRTTKCSHWAEKHSLKCLPKHLCTQMQYVHT